MAESMYGTGGKEGEMVTRGLPGSFTRIYDCFERPWQDSAQMFGMWEDIAATVDKG